MLSSEELLEQAAKDGSLNTVEWPRVLETVLARLEQIVHNEFPMPSIPRTENPRPPIDLGSSPPKASQGELPSADSHPSDSSSNQNAPASSPPAMPTSSHPPFHNSSPVFPNALPEGSLPPPLLAILTFVKNTLSSHFHNYPPYTIQRLAELILRPKQHYRFLPAYLNAIDRVVTVSSGTTAFPLPAIEVSSGAGPMLNGNVTAPLSMSALGSDESLGGALLTPIPWLRPGGASPVRAQVNGMDGVEAGDTDTDTVMTAEETMRENGAVTQGELLRQEQQASDPPAPVASMQNRTHVVAAHAAGAGADGGEGTVRDSDMGDLEQPHARGPERIGMEDTGPQEHAMGVGQVLDMEAAVGRSSHVSVPDGVETAPAESSQVLPSSDRAVNKKDEEGDVETTDADGNTEAGRSRSDADGDDTAPNVIDTTIR